jgi:hypothetical protein
MATETIIVKGTKGDLPAIRHQRPPVLCVEVTQNLLLTIPVAMGFDGLTCSFVVEWQRRRVRDEAKGGMP